MSSKVQDIPKDYKNFSGYFASRCTGYNTYRLKGVLGTNTQDLSELDKSNMSIRKKIKSNQLLIQKAV
jgi:hypothetical protein